MWKGGFFMAERIILNLVYVTDYGRPLTAATIRDPVFIREAARESVAEIRMDVDLLSILDPDAAEIRAAEADRLERILKKIIPDLEVNNGEN
jgi:hypothetical protein